MDGNVSGGVNYKIDWDSEDDLEIENIQLPSNSTLTPLGAGSISCNGEASSSRGPSQSKLIDHFVGMGFPDTLVIKAIEENGEGNTELILETLLTYSALENSPERLQCLNSPQQPECVDFRPPPLSINSDEWSSDYDETLLDDISDADSDSESWLNNNTDLLTDWEKKMMSLANMGYTVDEASIAMDRCGAEASIDELTDFICAAQMAKTADASYQDLPVESQANKKRKFFELMKKKKRRGYNNINGAEDEPIRLPNPMIGFGVPAEPCQQIHRTLPEDAIGPPYFYYENVALAPKGVWDTISRFLYSVEPEFVDSKYFCATARKRAYVHNLPIKNRFPILPLPPQTIHEALPLTRRWWPSWDTRTKLNCLQTSVGSAKMTERVRKALENWGDGEPPLSVQRYVLDECRKWNLVWVGKNKVAPLEPDEFEMLLGFPKNHTRGISRTDRYKSLGNSFQVDTVAYHLSVLKDIFPGGINVLSLFSGIGGAEMALYRLGIPLKNVVSVEKSEVNRTIVRGWWEQTNQKGNLIDYADVQEINGDMLEPLMNSFGGFDLVIGGSPCNNLAGSNRVSRDGLEGKESALFYDYFRILDLVKCIMSRYQ